MRPIAATTALVAVLALSACGGGGDDDEPAAVTPGTPKCTPAPGTSTALDIAPKWSVGDTRAVTITKSREETGEEPSESSATADLRVVATGAKGSRLEWKSTDLVLPDDQLPSDAKSRLRETAKEFAVVYATDPNGTYTAKLNVAQIRTQLEKVLDLLQEDPKAADSVARTRSIILSDAFIQTSVVKEIPVLHSAYGLALEQGKPERIVQEIPNPFGGSSLTAKGTAELVDVRGANGCAIVEVDVKPDRAALAKSITDTFGGQAKNVPNATRRAGLSVHNTARYTYDPGSGWLARVDLTQTVKINDKSRSDITVISTK